MPARESAAAALLLALMALPACSDSGDVLSDVRSSAPGTPYAGSLVSAPSTQSDDVRTNGGAAAQALECAGTPAGGGVGSPNDGLHEGSSSPEGALHEEVEMTPWLWPQSGWRQEAARDGRVLFSYDVEAKTKAAVVVTLDEDGATYADDWVAEAIAWCDVSEYPEDLPAAGAPQVWTDRTGRRVPTTTVQSFPGPEHCNWQTVTFLEVGDREFLRDPDGELADFVEQPGYAPDVPLPVGATDTGWVREGARLWLTSAAAYVDVGGRTERWSETTQDIGCA